ncbi:unnamed protein product [Adineta ricciae]|uniref:Cadherin domain-containing protein n=1 Tax=Adineta ricciae TaxID=249248 RepID=A0A813VWW6_ADIRI|nr:unnamed protein product [Adineta ricciae]
MLSHFWLVLVFIKYSFSKTLITNYPTVDLVENSPLNTLVIQLTTSLNITRTPKLFLLNTSGFECDVFTIVNGSIYTINSIDREEFLRRKYCLDNLYCKIELQILVDDGLAYWVIPIHIVDENDNRPEFAQNEIELKFQENILNGYKIPFSGAKDLDEGRNGEIHYVLDCSNDFHVNKSFTNQYIQPPVNCFPLFQLIVLSQSSSSVNYDRLALKFLPSSSVNIQNEYKLRLYAIDKNENGKQLDSSMNLIVKIDRKEKAPRFTQSEYDFVVTINSSSRHNESIVGRVHAMSNDPSQVIHYKLLSDSSKIRINSLTGEIVLSNSNLTKLDNEIEFFVQAWTLLKEKVTNFLSTRSKVKVIFRSTELLNNITYHFQTISSLNQSKIQRLNSTNTFVIDEHVQSNEDLLKISLISKPYPSDKYILSLDNYLSTFSLISTTPLNTYILRTRRRPTPKAIYMLNIGVKHRLSQQWLPNLRIEFIVIEQWSTTTMMTSTLSMKPRVIITNTTVYAEPIGFCIENKNYVLHENYDEEIGFLRVVETNVHLSQNRSLSSKSFLSINSSEITIDGCRMHMDNLESSLNKSLRYQLCSLTDDTDCYNISFTEEIDLELKSDEKHNLRSWFLPKKPIEIVMFVLSMVFVLITIVLVFLICRLKGVHICLAIKNYLFYGKKYGLNNNSHVAVSPSKMTQQVHSIVIRESRSTAFQPIHIENDISEPYIYNIDHLLDHKPLPSTNMFTLPSPAQVSSSSSLTCSLQRESRTRLTMDNRPSATPRTSSSSSFLQETKQLLEMISSNSNLDSSRLASDV